MYIIQNNPFRTLGVYANATSSAIAGRSMQLQAKLRSGLSAETPESLEAICGDIVRTPESISIARSALQRPADRLEHAMFWFTSADTTDITALDALGKGNMRLAEDIWKNSPESVSARHNLAVLMLATNRTAEASTTAESLFTDKPREICSLLAPGTSLSSAELVTLYKRLAPAVAQPVHEASSEVMEPTIERPKKTKPRPAVSVRTEPATKPATISPIGKRPTPTQPPSLIKNSETETASPITDTTSEPKNEILDALEYLNGCIKRLTNEKPSIEECSLFLDNADIGMSRLRNKLEPKDQMAYRSWADGCAKHLMSALSRLGSYHKGEPKTAKAMTLLSKCKSWGLSAPVEKEVNDYIARLYASKSNDSTMLIVIAVIIFIVLLQTCVYY